jgi:hypothetical protein
MCRDKVETREKSPGVLDLDLYKLITFNEKDFENEKQDHYNQLEEILAEAIKNILAN